MKKIDPEKIIKLVMFGIIIIYLLAIWFGTTPVSACTLQAGISKQIGSYNIQQQIPIAGISKEILKCNGEENELSVEENEKDVVQQCLGKQFDVPSNNSFKSYMDGDCIKSKSSEQYKLKNKYILDTETGIWQVDGRYCIAVGSYYTDKVGTCIDVVMENGNVLECILADCKKDQDTDSLNRQNPNGSIIEFIVNMSSLPKMVRRVGDCSYADESMFGEIESIIVYD